MQEQLLSEEVWVAFDHTARLLDAFRQKPNDFVAFPAPSGPKGKGFVPVIAGLAIPKYASSENDAKMLIDYMTKPNVQISTLQEVGFYPILDISIPLNLPPGIALTAKAISAQSGAKDAMPSLLPIGLGEQSGVFSKTYTDTFQLIVLRNRNIRSSLRSQARKLSRIMRTSKAPCWQPDASSGKKPCPVQ